MQSFKIPQFLSKEFSKAPKEKKDEICTRYKNWYSDSITQAYIEYLESKLNDLIKASEKDENEITEFQYMMRDAKDKASRKAIRELLHVLNWKVE